MINNIQKEPIYLAKGKRSNVFLTAIKIKENKDNNKYKIIKVVIKKSLPSLQHAEARIQHEANILKLVNKHKIGPKLYESNNNQLIEEYIKGQTIEKFIEEKLKIESKNKQKNNKRQLIRVIKQILTQCRTLDKLKINKEEMSNPYKHILLNRQRAHQKCAQQGRDKRIILKPVMIDFERARYSESPTNVTQFFQYLMHHKMVQLNEKTKQKLKNYKTNPTEINYKELIKLIK